MDFRHTLRVFFVPFFPLKTYCKTYSVVGNACADPYVLRTGRVTMKMVVIINGGIFFNRSNYCHRNTDCF